MIPESLIAVLTITFVVGMTQMRKRKVLTRKLSALEALGGITNICSDKTGTLTQGQMVTRKAWVPGVGIYTVSHTDDAADPTRGRIGLAPAMTKAEVDATHLARQEELDRIRSSAALRFNEPAEKVQRDQGRIDNDQDDAALDEKTEPPEVVPELEAFVTSMALCNLATVRFNDKESAWQTTGDPTEIALQIFAHRFGCGKKTLTEQHGWKQVAEYPFDSSIKRMSVVYNGSGLPGPMIFTKGAVERVVELCVKVGLGEHEEDMTDEMREAVTEQMGLLADQGLRVLAVARKSWPGEVHEHSNIPREEIESGLTLLGLAGLYDPPRLETKDAVKRKLIITIIPSFTYESQNNHFHQNARTPASASTC